ncbi:MAG: DoxX family protein [Candidatus Nanoarchaeia archaeon]
MTKKKTKVAVPLKMTEVNTKIYGSCCETKWNLVPLRIVLGLLFLVAGLPKLIGLIGGGSQLPGFFATLGIPLPLFSAWLVAIVEVAGGLLLMLGLLTWCVGLILGIVIIVATITTSFNPFNWGSLTQHLLYLASLVAVMYGSKYFSLSQYCRCKGYKK